MKTLYLLCLLGIICFPSVHLRATSYGPWSVTNFNNENGLPQNSVKFIEMDRDGYLWLATESGIVRYDGKHFRLFDNANSALMSNRYLMMGKTNSGRVYCVDDRLEIAYHNEKSGFSKTYNMGKLVVDRNGGLVDLATADLGIFKPSFDKFQIRHVDDFMYYSIARDKGFIFHGSRLVYISAGKTRWIDTLHDRTRIYRATGSIGNRAFYINRDHGITFVDSNGHRTNKSIPVKADWNNLLANSQDVSFFNNDGHSLLAVDGDIYELTLRDEQLDCRLLAATDISDIHCVRYYPEKDLLVIGSNTEGLSLLKRQQLAVYGKSEENPGSFYALAPYDKTHVLTNNGIMPDHTIVPGMSDVQSRDAILHDRKGHYWFSSRFNLLETDSQFRLLRTIPFRRMPRCIQEDDLGRIWVATGANDFGMVEGNSIVPYRLNGIEDKSVFSFIPAGNQTFWMVGFRLLLWIDIKNHEQRIYHEFDKIELRTAYLDKKGNLWLGSYGQGYFMMSNGRLIRMPEDDKHHLNVVHCFLEDDKGFMWMTTNNGLFQSATRDLYNYVKHSKGPLYHHYYGTENGLKASEFNGGCTPSGIRLGNNEFAFPSMGGIVHFNPENVVPRLPEGPLFFDDILVDGRIVAERDLATIPPAFKRLELTVSSPFFGNARNLNIQYNIEGLGDQWYAVGEDHHIVLNRLKYGNYKIRLRKKAGFGADNYITASLPLVIMPFFYQTWWFRILVVLGVVAVLLLIVRTRYRYLIRQKNQLEVQVKERTSELVYNHKLVEKLTLMIAHDLKSPLYFLSMVTGHLREKVAKHKLPEIERASNDIKNTSDQVYQFVEEFSLWASSVSGSFSINETSFPLADLLRELNLFFQDMLQANGNTLVINAAADYTLETDRGLFKIILRNIIDNANKHSRNCAITISTAETENGHIEISITDTGKGMSELALKKIHERIEQPSKAASIEKNSRLGYQIIIDFAARLGLGLKVDSEQGKGTCVHLTLRGKQSEATAILIEEVVSTR